MRVELSRRRRRPRKRRPARSRDLAVLAFPPGDDGPTLLFGPYTRQGTLAVSQRELANGRKVQLALYERVRALFEDAP